MNTNVETITSWLAKKKTRMAAQKLALGGVAMIAAIAILFFTFWFAYAVIWIGSVGVSALCDLALGFKIYLPHVWRALGSGVFLVLLFRQHLRTAPWYWGTYERRDYSSGPALAALQFQTGVAGSVVSMLAHPGASANMVADILLTGPRLVSGAFRLFRDVRWLKGIDEAGCGRLLDFLNSRPDPVPWEDLKAAGWEEWFPQLQCIDGVQFLKKGPLLSSDLRNELNGLH